MNSDGSGKINLSNPPFGDLEPTWSPDGDQLAFIQLVDGVNGISIVNSEDGTLLGMVLNTASAQEPKWSP